MKRIKSPRRLALSESKRVHPDIGFGSSWDWEHTVNLERGSKSYLKSKGFRFIYEIDVPNAPKMKRGYPNTFTAWTKKAITVGDRERIAAHIKKFMGY
ncbi:MAG: hypothetical protein HY553_14680 [Elusimicrobia bacterium]|nr:hypothetical protein [Elusimicrobiota bacterium]